MKKMLGTTLIVSAFVLVPSLADAQETVFEGHDVLVNEEVINYQSQDLSATEIIRESNLVDEAGNVVGERTETQMMIVETEAPVDAPKLLVDPAISHEPVQQPMRPEDERAEKMFGAIDVNGDSIITKDEFMAFHNKMSERRRQRMENNSAMERRMPAEGAQLHMPNENVESEL